MQTLGISESTPRTESRFKSLFWPSIQSGTDVDYLGAQGYWVCVFIAVMSLIALMVLGNPITAVFSALFCYMSGIGVRERSRFAAIAILFLMVIDSFVTGVNVVRVLILALLVSNVRATWLASQWQSDSEEAALPPRMNETFGDKFADMFPQWAWPKVRFVYYVFAIMFLGLSAMGIVAILARRLG